MGEDNLRAINKWRSYERILSEFDIFVYPRAITEGEDGEAEGAVLNHSRVNLCDAPMIRISSTFLRNAIRDQKDIRYLVPDKVANYISNNYLYE
jgi:nicotinate-nucleotide adenylyltransferase